jgi:hypothetical protein
MLSRAEDEVPAAGAAPPLLLTDRPWAEIEAEIAARHREPFWDPDPLSGLAGLEFPIVIELPDPSPPPLLLDSVPHAERERLDRNQQRGLGQYKRPEGEYSDELANAPLQVQELLYRPVAAKLEAALRQLDREDLGHPEFKRLKAAGKVAADKVTRSAAPDYSGVIAAAQALVDWIGSHLADKAERARTTKVKDGGKLAKLVDDKVQAAEAAAEKEAKRSDKRAKLLALKRSLVDLGNSVYQGASQADRERFAALASELDALLEGAPVAPAATAPAGPDPAADEDGRTGTEPALVYRGETYHLIPGNPAHTYGRIDQGLRLDDAVEAAYLDALQRGFIPVNENGASGVKDKPLHFEIKLIVKRAKALGVGNTARITTSSRDGLVQASTGIRYLTFDRWHDAH